ncbi:hypothetical protein CLV01_2735 [Delftia sp. 60]|uniref:hypothetical protein n=1 Tax=Delftia sp. 60 TaxID=2035216 RepID=UPI000C19D0E1|nr:hypothetical protein [Delftia sp. 60]PIF38465.1 hypothetical protein CLU98_3717 [Burkholderiales bacterium 23]PIF66354.1 hypothetical protein CLV01_2735 [Delftia sp. 60]
MSAAAKKLSAATLLARHAAAGAVLTLVLAGCSSRPPAPDWALNAESASQRASTAYLEGRQRVQAMEWDKARAEVAATGRTDLAARLELMRCAAQVASLEWDDCPGYQALALALDAAPAEAAYARYLQGRPRPEDVALLPELQRPVAQALLGGSASALAAVRPIKEPLSRLVAAGAALRAGAAQPQLLELGAETASAQGWRRAVMAWLLLQARAHDQAGEVDKAQAVRRRLSLLEKTASGGGTSAGK